MEPTATVFYCEGPAPGWYFRIGLEQAPLMYAGPFHSQDDAANRAGPWAEIVSVRPGDGNKIEGE